MKQFILSIIAIPLFFVYSFMLPLKEVINCSNNSCNITTYSLYYKNVEKKNTHNLHTGVIENPHHGPRQIFHDYIIYNFSDCPYLSKDKALDASIKIKSSDIIFLKHCNVLGFNCLIFLFILSMILVFNLFKRKVSFVIVILFLLRMLYLLFV